MNAGGTRGMTKTVPRTADAGTQTYLTTASTQEFTYASTQELLRAILHRQAANGGHRDGQVLQGGGVCAQVGKFTGVNKFTIEFTVSPQLGEQTQEEWDVEFPPSYVQPRAGTSAASTKQRKPCLKGPWTEGMRPTLLPQPADPYSDDEELSSSSPYSDGCHGGNSDDPSPCYELNVTCALQLDPEGDADDSELDQCIADLDAVRSLDERDYEDFRDGGIMVYERDDDGNVHDARIERDEEDHDDDRDPSADKAHEHEDDDQEHYEYEEHG